MRRRARHRKLFRKMATDMASRYLTQMPVFNQRGLSRLDDLLATEPETISTAKQAQLRKKVEARRQRYGITDDRNAKFARQVARYLATKADRGDDLYLAMLSILYDRYAKRTRGGSLFPNAIDPDPRRPLNIDASVADGAKIHLLHEFGRPYFFGLEMLCDASSENAEQFLQLTSRLVAQLETRAHPKER